MVGVPIIQGNHKGCPYGGCRAWVAMDSRLRGNDGGRSTLRQAQGERMMWDGQGERGGGWIPAPVSEHEGRLCAGVTEREEGMWGVGWRWDCSAVG